MGVHALLIVVELILSIILLLVVLDLCEVTCPTCVILFCFLHLKLSKDLVRLLALLE